MQTVYLFCFGFFVSCIVCFGIVASEAVFVSVMERLTKRTKNE